MEQNYLHFAHNIFKCKKIFVFPSKLQLVPENPIDNKSALVWLMAWCWIGGKPFPDPVLMKSLAYCDTRPQLDKLERPFWEYPPQ